MVRLLLAMLVLAQVPAVLANDTVDAEVYCETQAKQCQKHCARQKTLGVFKGEAWKRCSGNCAATEKSCRADELDVDEFEVILGRATNAGGTR